MKDNEVSGVLAAVASPFFMAIGFIIWDVIWSKSGGSPYALNLYKCNLASVGFIVAGLIFGFTIGSDNESSVSVESIGYLVLSGFIGIIVGDLAWLAALKELGATRVLVIDTIKPFTAAFFGWCILGESIQKVAFSGIALTAVGVLLVSLEGEGESESESAEEGAGENNDDKDLDEELREELREKHSIPSSGQASDGENSGVDMDCKLPPVQIKLETQSKNPESRRMKWKGYALAITNIFLDTYGSVLTKQHGTRFSTWAINLIRFGSSGIIMIVTTCIMYLYNRKRLALNQNANPAPWYLLPQMDRSSWIKISVGVLFVTFCCPALSNYALFQIALALALTLNSITPLYALLLEWLIHGSKKKPTLKSTLGAVLAVAGVAILSIFSKEAS